MEFSDYVFKITVSSTHGGAIWFCPPDEIMSGSEVDLDLLTDVAMMRMVFPEVADQITDTFLKSVKDRKFEIAVRTQGIITMYSERDEEWV